MQNLLAVDHRHQISMALSQGDYHRVTFYFLVDVWELHYELMLYDLWRSNHKKWSFFIIKAKCMSTVKDKDYSFTHRVKFSWDLEIFKESNIPEIQIPCFSVWFNIAKSRLLFESYGPTFMPINRYLNRSTKQFKSAFFERILLKK